MSISKIGNKDNVRALKREKGLDQIALRSELHILGDNFEAVARFKKQNQVRRHLVVWENALKKGVAVFTANQLQETYNSLGLKPTPWMKEHVGVESRGYSIQELQEVVNIMRQKLEVA